MILLIKKILLGGVITLLASCSAYNGKGFSVEDTSFTSGTSTTEFTPTTIMNESISHLPGWPLDEDGTSTPIHTCNSTIHIHESFDVTPYNFVAETSTEKLVLQTVTYEDKIIGMADYYNKETGEIAHAEKLLYPNNSLDNQNRMQFDLSLPSGNTDISHTSNVSNNLPQENVSNNMPQEPDILNDPLSDSALETRRQMIEENQIAQIGERNKNFQTTGKIIHELLIPKDRILYLSDAGTLDSDLILEKTHTIKNLITALNSPTIKARFERIKFDYLRLNNPKRGRDHRSKNELQLLDTLISGQITQILNRIIHPDLNVAQSAFDELKQLWHWKREHTFLGNVLKYGTGETGFIAKIGVDIMKIAEKSLITRQDYIAKHANAQEQKTIQEYREKCYMLQQKGNSSELFNQKEQLYSCINANGNKNDLIANVCLAIVENCLLDPITTVFRSIIREPSLEKACDHLKNLEKQIVIQAEQHGIIPMSEVRTWVINHYGFDVLDAAQNCYRSRPDYVYTPENQSYLSDTIKPILHNIESKDLPRAHAELVHLEKQIDNALTERNITDPIAQKEYIKKSLGRDVLALAHKTYEARSDHKTLVESFMAIDVNQATATILENNNNYESVANEMSDLTKCVFINARLCKLDFIENIENHIIDSLYVIKAPQNDAEFVFNVTVVDHLLTDIQQVSQSIVNGEPTLWQRSPELLMRGFEKFFKGLNPITQVTSICHLLKDTAVAAFYIVDDALDVTLHPNPMEQKNFFLKGQVCESLVNAAQFTTDLIIGDVYLSPDEYRQRTAHFKDICASVMTAENIVDLVAQVAADFVYCKGIPSVFIYLKEIDAATKLEKQVAKVAETFKKAVDTHLANNPIMVTAEGVTLQMSNDVKNVGNTINSASLGQKTILRAANMQEFFELPFGKTLIKSSQKTSQRFQHSPIYKITKDIPGTDLKKGYFYYLDRFHNDHIEVFDHAHRCVNVYNLDGTANTAKHIIAQQNGRNIKNLMKGK